MKTAKPNRIVKIIMLYKYILIRYKFLKLQITRQPFFLNVLYFYLRHL
jgi:hypothetical protein